MDAEEKLQEEQEMREVLEQDSDEEPEETRDFVPVFSTRSEQEDIMPDARVFYNIDIALELIETDDQGVENEFAEAVTEIEGLKSFPCSKCSKICKSKGGLTRHTNSKHGDSVSIPSTTTPLCYETITSIVDTIKENIVKEKLYGENINAVVEKAIATKELFDEVLPLYTKFSRSRNQDKLLQSFYGLMPKSAELLNCTDSRVANLVMIHIPDHLVGFLNVQNVSQERGTESAPDCKIEPSEHGPLSYISGYVISKLSRASKSKEENNELQALLQNLKSEQENNSYILARTRGGLVTPCEDIVRILHEAEICFRKEVDKSKLAIRNIPVDAICYSTLSLPIVKSLWQNIVMSSGVNPSGDTQKLCLENIVKLYLKVRSFSYARDYISRYRIKEKQNKKKGLRKDLKQS
jgi:uncharacterized C2H2 Zn-finger protein